VRLVLVRVVFAGGSQKKSVHLGDAGSVRSCGVRCVRCAALFLLELRQLGSALKRPPADLSPIGRRDSKFPMEGVGATPAPEVAQAGSRCTWLTWPRKCARMRPA
jgi:hypothetical protein